MYSSVFPQQDVESLPLMHYSTSDMLVQAFALGASVFIAALSARLLAVVFSKTIERSYNRELAATSPLYFSYMEGVKSFTSGLRGSGGGADPESAKARYFRAVEYIAYRRDNLSATASMVVILTLVLVSILALKLITAVFDITIGLPY